jgi:Holliday junction resolvase
MGRMSREKGARGERELCSVLRSRGWPDACRTSDGRAQAGRGDIAGGPAGVVFEVRRTERLNVWQALEDAQGHAENGELPIAAFRRSRGGWYAALPLDRLLELLREREAR